MGRKDDATVEWALLEHCAREDLNCTSQRALAVLDPLRVVLTNYPEDQVEHFELANNPEDASEGTRSVPFGRELFIERDDFREDPPRKFFRLAPGREVRLRGAYLVTCQEVVRDADGSVVELRCSYDPETRGGDAPDGRKVKGTLHWVSAAHALDAEVRLYDKLFSHPRPEDAEVDWRQAIDPASLEARRGCKLEPSLAKAKPGDRFQFERLGYFCVDPGSAPGAPVFNRTVTLRDTWAKLAARGEKRS